MNSTSGSVAYITIGHDKGIRERLYQMKSYNNMKLNNHNSLLKLWS